MLRIMERREQTKRTGTHRGGWTPRLVTPCHSDSCLLSPDSSKRGFVLICVLWVLAILTVIAVGFGRRSMLDRRAAAFSFDHAKALCMARGAVVRGMVELRNKAVIDTLYRQTGRTGVSQQWARPMNMLAGGTYFKRDENMLAGGAYAPESGPEEGEKTGDFCICKIRDEEGLISINTENGIELLKQIEGLDPSIIRKIDSRRTGGDDSDEGPRPFQTIEELRFLDEIDDEIWYGDGKWRGLKDILTCWGDGKININTAPPEVLRCIPGVDEDIISAVLQFRAGPDGQIETEDDIDFKSGQDVVDYLRMSCRSEKTIPALIGSKGYCKTDSQYFTIQGIATRRQGKVRATCSATVLIQGPKAVVIKWRSGEEASGVDNF